MLNLFSHRTSPVGGPSPCPLRAGMTADASANISHSPELVKALTEEHHLLLGLFEDAEVQFARNRIGLAVERLREFAQLCCEHRMKEDVRLLIFLEHRFQGDEVIHQRLREFRRERDRNVRRVRHFIEKYEALEVDRDLASGFLAEAREIGALLVSFLEQEEEAIYPIYERLSA